MSFFLYFVFPNTYFDIYKIKENQSRERGNTFPFIIKSLSEFQNAPPVYDCQSSSDAAAAESVAETLDTSGAFG